MPQLVHPHMGIGAFSMEMTHSARILEELKWGRHLLIRWGEKRLPAVVILAVTPSRRGVTVSGHLLPWWMGFEGRGALIRDRDYVASVERILNHDFSIPGLKHWTPQGEGVWREATFGPYKGKPVTAAVTPNTWPLEEELLVSDSLVRAPSKSVHRARAWFRREPTYDRGTLRLRLVYGGRFSNADFQRPFNEWTGLPTSTGQNDIEVLPEDPAGLLSGPVARINSGQVNLITNPDFANGLVGWVEGEGAALAPGTWNVVATSDSWNGHHYAARPAINAVNPKWMQADRATSTPAVDPWPTMGGEEYELHLVTRPNPGAIPDGDIGLYLGLLRETDVLGGPPSGGFVGTPRARPDGPEGTAWRVLQAKISIDEETAAIVPSIQTSGMTVGQWDVAWVLVKRTRGNRDLLIGKHYGMHATRTYTWKCRFRADAGITGGMVRLQATCFDTIGGLPPLIVHGPSLPIVDPSRGTGDGLIHEVKWDLTCPPGYDQARPELASEDVYGNGYVWVAAGSMVDADPDTRWIERRAATTTGVGGGFLEILAQAPEGARDVHVEIATDPYGLGYILDKTSLIRYAVNPATGNRVAQDCCVHPKTGLPLLQPGRLLAPGVLQNDYWVKNQTNLDLLMTLCRSGLYLPELAWRITADDKLDVGPSEELFQDRRNIVLMEGDYVLMPPVEYEKSIADRATDISVVGAEVQDSHGFVSIIESQVENPLEEPASDWFGNPFERSMVVEDSEVDTQEHADALAALTAAQNGFRQTVQVKLSDYRVAGHFDTGDWIYLHAPDAGLEDEAYLQTKRGRTIAPARLPVQSMELSMGGGGFNFDIRREDGSLFPIPRELIHWERGTTAVVELGDLPPEFTGYDQGGPMGMQFMKWLRFRQNRRRT